jgi:pre-mRNA-processing factor 6
MDSRRRAHREASEEAELAKHRAERPKLQQQFAELKRGLAVVTDAEWESIFDVSDITRRKRGREERSIAVPDSIIVGDRGIVQGEIESSLDPRQQVRPTLGVVNFCRLMMYRNMVDSRLRPILAP